MTPEINAIIEKILAALTLKEADLFYDYIISETVRDGDIVEQFENLIEMRLKLDAQEEAAREELEIDYSKCPICGEPLEVDEEYMQGTYGAAWSNMPKSEWTFFCSDEDECGEAGTYSEILWVKSLKEKGVYQ